MIQTEAEAFLSELHGLIFTLVKDYGRCDQACLALLGLTASQGYTVLSIPRNGCTSMNELSERMGLANSTMTRMLDNLVRKGLAFRSQDEADRRIVLVGLTTEGLKMQATLENEKEALMKEAFADIQGDEYPQILDAFKKIAKAMKTAVERCKSSCLG